MSIPKRLSLSDAADGEVTKFDLWVHSRAASGCSASQIIGALCDHPDYTPLLEAYILVTVAMYSIPASESVQ